MRSLSRLCEGQRGQDIAEYAVMLAVISVLVVGTIRWPERKQCFLFRRQFGSITLCSLLFHHDPSFQDLLRRMKLVSKHRLFSTVPQAMLFFSMRCCEKLSPE